MTSKTIFLLLTLAFAVLLLFSSQITDARDLDASQVEKPADTGPGQLIPSYPSDPNCRYGCCDGGNYYAGCRCCRTYAEASAYKQAHEAQTHN